MQNIIVKLNTHKGTLSFPNVGFVMQSFVMGFTHSSTMIKGAKKLICSKVLKDGHIKTTN